MTMIEQVNVAKALKSALKESGMRQADIAERLGVNQSSISGSMNRPKIGADVLIMMMEAMGYAIMVGKKEKEGFTAKWELTKGKD